MIVGLEDDPFDAALMNTPVEALDVSPRVAPTPRAPAPRAPVTSPPEAPRGRRTETARLPVPSLQEALAQADRALAHSARHPEARPLIGLGALAMIPIAMLIGFVGLLAGALIGASGEPTAKAAPKVAIAAPFVVATRDDQPVEAVRAPEPEVADVEVAVPARPSEATSAPEATPEARPRRRPRARARRARARRARPARATRASSRPVRIASR